MKLRQHIESPQPHNILQQLLNVANLTKLDSFIRIIHFYSDI